jgi:hypothetical protein
MVLAGLSHVRAEGVDAPEHVADTSERAAVEPGEHACLRELERLGVAHEPAQRRGIDVGVLVLGDIGGVSYRGYRKAPLVLDCSLVVSLAHLGPFMTAHGIERVTYSSAYQRRKVRGSDRWSKHSFGLAIDIHSFSGEELGTLQVKDDYEQGLGDDIDCIGQPLTQGGAILRALHCEIARAELFDSVLTPDYDAGHYNHFHVEVLPWGERAPASLPVVADRPR